MDKTEATAEAVAPFPSLPALRARHAELSGRYRTAAARDDPIFWDEVERFLRQARATGARLESADDREAAQAILNVWSSNLYRARRGDVDAELAEYDPGALRDLSDDDCPYVGLARSTSRALAPSGGATGWSTTGLSGSGNSDCSW